MILALSIRFKSPSNRHVRQAKVTRNSALRQELRGYPLGKHESSPRLAARDGMEQEPYEFRIRFAKPESESKATYGAFR
jgi:hypothetical protein